MALSGVVFGSGNRSYFIRLIRETQLAGRFLGKEQDWGSQAVQQNGKLAIIFSYLNIGYAFTKFNRIKEGDENR